MTMTSFLTTFQSILDAVLAAMKIAAPLVAVADPVVGALMLQATNAAVSVEQILPAEGTGLQKARLVQEQTQATVDVINGILVAQGKPPLAANITDIVQQHVRVVVAGLNTVHQAVEAAGAARV
jgi:hypothetical protein